MLFNIFFILPSVSFLCRLTRCSVWCTRMKLLYKSVLLIFCWQMINIVSIISCSLSGLLMVYGYSMTFHSIRLLQLLLQLSNTNTPTVNPLPGHMDVCPDQCRVKEVYRVQTLLNIPVSHVLSWSILRLLCVLPPYLQPDRNNTCEAVKTAWAFGFWTAQFRLSLSSRCESHYWYC